VASLEREKVELKADFQAQLHDTHINTTSLNATIEKVWRSRFLCPLQRTGAYCFSNVGFSS